MATFLAPAAAARPLTASRCFSRFQMLRMAFRGIILIRAASRHRRMHSSGFLIRASSSWQIRRTGPIRPHHCQTH